VCLRPSLYDPRFTSSQVGEPRKAQKFAKLVKLTKSQAHKIQKFSSSQARKAHKAYNLTYSQTRTHKHKDSDHKLKCHKLKVIKLKKIKLTSSHRLQAHKNAKCSKTCKAQKAQASGPSKLIKLTNAQLTISQAHKV